MLIPVVERSKAWVWGSLLLAGVVGTNLTEMHGCLSVVSVTATGRSLVLRNDTECSVSECDLETSTLRRPWPTRAVEPEKSVTKKELRFNETSTSKE
jgi:hypothetical protein